MSESQWTIAVVEGTSSRAGRARLIGALALHLSLIALAQADDPKQAARLLENARASIYCYDVKITCVEHLLRKELPPKSIDVGGGRKVSVPDFKVLPWDKRTIRKSVYRQIFSDQGRYPVPLRRVQQFHRATSDTESILAFDGTVRRSLYNGTKGGLVGPPPDDKHEFVEYMCDYLTVVGIRVPGKYDLLSDLAIKLPPEKIEIQDQDGCVFLHLHPLKPENAAREGYQIWFDKKHDMMVREYRRYAFTTDRAGIRGDRVATEMVVHEFKPIEGGGWVPIRATIKDRFDRAEHVGALRKQTEIIVDPSESSWNVRPSEDVFTFDFPVGTWVTDNLRGVAFVVGQKDAGRNLDELIENATGMIPTRDEGRKLAGWDKPIQRPEGYYSTPLARVLIYLNAAGLLALCAVWMWRRLRRPTGSAGTR